MRHLVALAVLGTASLGVGVPAAHAGRSTDIALSLASFAVFNQVVAPLLRPYPHPAFPRREVIYYQQPTVVYSQPATVVYTQPAPIVYAAPPPPQPTVVHYPHGRYELQIQGQQYVWVWIPAVPPPPPPPPAP